MAVDPCDKDCFIAKELRLQLVKFISGKLYFLLNSVQPFKGFSFDAAQSSLVSIVSVDDDGPLWRIKAEVERVAEIGEEQIHDQVYQEQKGKNQGAMPLLPGYGRDKIGYDQCEEMRDKLGKGQETDSAVAKKIGVVRAVEEKQQTGIENHNKIVIPISVIFEHESAISKDQPEDKEKQERQTEMDSFKNRHLQQSSVFFACFQMVHMV